jgi:hypothetical protein
MILIYPPAAKPCEPPAGIAKLAGALSRHGIKHNVLDANVEGLLYLMNHSYAQSGSVPDRWTDKWTARAFRHLPKNLAALRNRNTYRSIARYRRAVADVNRVLEQSIAGTGVTLSLSNHHHDKLSPLRSADLLIAAEHPELDPFYPYFKQRLTRLVEQEQPSMVGFSLTYLSQALCTFAMLGFLRRKFPGLALVCGGGLVTSWLKRPGWNNPFAGLVNHFIAGPGESALLALGGIDKKQHNHCIPDYGALPLKDYLSPGVVLPYSGSSGCFWNRCSFCPEKAEGNSYIPVQADRATADISFLVKEMQPKLIHLLDNAISPALMSSLIDSHAGVPWYGFARVGKELADVDFCKTLKRSGCAMLKLGIESGDQNVLDKMQKGIDLGTASLALKALKQAGIASYVYLLFGTPSETSAGARKTLDFTVKHSDEISFLNLALFNMPVGGPEAQELKTSSFYEGDLSLYTDFSHPGGWERKHVRQFLENEFKRHPAVSAILRREPPFFTSNHAPFFAMEHTGVKAPDPQAFV